MTWRTAAGLLVGVILLEGCTDYGSGVEACVNPKLLRVRVGDTAFDFPNTVSSVGGPDATRERLGITDLNFTANRRDPANRWDCNERAHPTADFGDELGFVYRGDGTEPSEYRMGLHMHAVTKVGRYDPRPDGGWRSRYLADVEDIGKVRFVGRVDIPPRGGMAVREAVYTFAHQGRELKTTCIMSDASTTSGNDADHRPAFPYSCVPNIAFRVGDIVIGVDQQSYTGGHGSGNKVRLIPPEEWPRQWAYTINRILSFRVRPTIAGNHS